MPTNTASISDKRRCINSNPHRNFRIGSALLGRVWMKDRFIESFIRAFLSRPMYGRIEFSHNVYA
jgi:hypothetical protein